MKRPGRRRRQHPEELEDSEPEASPRPALARDPTAALLEATVGDPEVLAARLAEADQASQTRALERLQRQRGNGFVVGVVGAMARGRRGVFSGAGSGRGLVVAHDVVASTLRTPSPIEVQREDDEAVALDEAQAVGGATEAIGPPASSAYGLAAVSLADVAAQIGARDEAGHVGWVTSFTFSAPKGVIDAVHVSAAISLELPSWAPPSTMLPRARAEWARWYAALVAHEQGHIDLVHANFDGLAQAILNTTPARGKARFEAAKAKLSRESKAYDKSNDHGRSAGTVMDVSIEDKEIEEVKERKKQEDGEKATKQAPAGAAP